MELKFSCSPTTLDTCSINGQDFIAVGLLSGEIQLLSFAGKVRSTKDTKVNDENCLDLCWSRWHKKSVRKGRFALPKHLKLEGLNPRHLYTTTQNKALVQWDMETGKKVRCLRTALEGAPHSLCATGVASSSKCFMATGDENGVIQIWDFDSKDAMICQFSDQQDYITDLSPSHDLRLLLATSGDATLASYNFRAKKLDVRSECMASELLSLTVLESCGEHSGRVVCGGGEGSLEIFKEGQYGNLLERMETGHEDTIDCMTSIGPNLLATGSTLDGSIQLIHINPNRKLGQFAFHEDGVEEIDTTSDGNFLVSCGHDDTVRLTDLKPILKQVKTGKRKSAKLKKVKLNNDEDKFFADLE